MGHRNDGWLRLVMQTIRYTASDISNCSQPVTEKYAQSNIKTPTNTAFIAQ